MRALIGCEKSGVVREAFRAKGWDAWSCDTEPCDDGSKYHLQCDVLSVLKPNWDLMIAHPPCTYLSVSGLHWNKRIVGRQELTEDALVFVQKLMDAPVEHIAIENPISCISTRIRKPDQIIQPYNFGEDASKQTCLWLKNLPKLKSTLKIDPHYGCKNGERWPVAEGEKCKKCDGKCGNPKRIWANQTPSGQNKLGPSPTRQAERSKTYQGIADAMASQWSPSWIRCSCCEDFFCTIHEMHAYDCDCPPIDEWKKDPYSIWAPGFQSMFIQSEPNL